MGTSVYSMTNSLQEIEVFEKMGLCGWICFFGIFEPNEHLNQKTGYMDFEPVGEFQKKLG